MRLLYKYVDADNLYGVDPWSESLRVCREHGVIGHLALSEWLPRTLPFVGPFDLIYAFSVFTHLSEEATAASLETLRRYIAHHGKLVITVRPPEIWENIQQPNMIAEHHRRGFAFSPLNNSATYGDSSITTEYLTQKFPFWRVEKQLLHGEPLQHYLTLASLLGSEQVDPVRSLKRAQLAYSWLSSDGHFRQERRRRMQEPTSSWTTPRTWRVTRSARSSNSGRRT